MQLGEGNKQANKLLLFREGVGKCSGPLAFPHHWGWGRLLRSSHPYDSETQPLWLKLNWRTQLPNPTSRIARAEEQVTAEAKAIVWRCSLSEGWAQGEDLKLRMEETLRKSLQQTSLSLSTRKGGRIWNLSGRCTEGNNSNNKTQTQLNSWLIISTPTLKG